MIEFVLHIFIQFQYEQSIYLNKDATNVISTDKYKQQVMKRLTRYNRGEEKICDAFLI